ncbi:tetratricopeptide repeat protein [Streptomyces sp. P9-A4]|uniref:tetratricopeptide repeat protein n=1 Tax=Streptomyces sp. P9-A4 TaxID=3072285 RepID=UPI002FCC01F9
MSVEQHVTAHSGYAYGVIGADIHVYGDDSPVYLLQNWRRAPATDPEWLRELPSRMLNSRFEVVPFTGRDAELAGLRAWRDEGPRLAVRWMHAPGGQGKTRLAARFADSTQDEGRSAEALAAAEEAVSLRERLYAEHPDPHREDLAQTLSNLGICLEAAGRRSEGRAATRRAVELYRAACEANPAAYTLDLARVLNNLGRFLALDGRWEEALARVVEGIALAERSAADNPPAYGTLLGHLRRTRDGCLRMLDRPAAR